MSVNGATTCLTDTRKRRQNKHKIYQNDDFPFVPELTAGLFTPPPALISSISLHPPPSPPLPPV